MPDHFDSWALDRRSLMVAAAAVPAVLATPAAAQPPWAKIAPVPLMVMSPTTRAKQELPLLDLLTAPLKVTLACGK